MKIKLVLNFGLSTFEKYFDFMRGPNLLLSPLCLPVEFEIQALCVSP